MEGGLAANQIEQAKRSDAELTSLAKSRARFNTENAAQQIADLRAIGIEYRKLAGDATLSGEQQRVAANLATEAEAKQAILLGGSGRAHEEAGKKVGGFGDTLKGLAATFGTTIGAIALINFGKSVISSAAEAQKAGEAITETFGKAGDSIKKFANGAATNLGLSSQQVETTAASFGIAYKQIGIGQTQAASMTIGFEKLAGAIATIKGVSPATVFSSLSTAAAGNTKALRALGITIDQSQLKYAALKLGIINTTTQALTPAQKAEAVYAIATAKLGQYQADAAKHAGDLSNVQARLSAEWSNAKGVIGEALLPALTKLVTKLADWLGKMEKSGQLQRDVNTAMHDASIAVGVLKDAFNVLYPPLKKVVDAVGGLKNALIILGGVIAAYKVGNAVTALLNLGGAAAKAEGGVAGLKGALIGLRALGVIGVTVAVAFVIAKGGEALANFLGKQKGLNDFTRKYLGTGVGNTPVSEYVAALQEAIKTKNTSVLSTLAGLSFAPSAVRSAAAAALKKLSSSYFVPLPKGGLPGTKPNDLKSTFDSVISQIRGYKATVDTTLAGWKQELALKKQYDVGQSVADKIFNNQVKQSMQAANQGLTAAIKSGKQLVLNAIQEGNKQIEAAQQSLNDYQIAAGRAAYQATQTAAKNLQDAGNRALSQLKTFSNDLQTQIDKVLGIKFGAQNLTGAGPFSSAAAQIKALLKSPGGASQALLQAAKSAQAQLNPVTALSESKRLEQAKTVIASHLKGIEQAALTGKTTIKGLTDQLTGYLNKAGLGYKNLVHYVGKTNADQIQADITNYAKQLQQFGLLPTALKKKLLAATGGNLTSPIVNIASVMQANAKAEKALQQKTDRGLRQHLARLQAAQVEAAKRLHNAQVTADARIAKARTHLADVTEKESLDVARHHLAEAKQQTSLLKKLNGIATNIQKTNAMLAGVQVNPKAIVANPGHVATHARASAAAGTGA